ncbi:MAG: extracellular solute-binding protein, partial [Clostridia bacterium]|nr:extracellular solute-binding protein [Clostridia bacterium]
MKLRSIVALLLAAVMLLGCTAAVAEDKVKVSIWSTFTNAQDEYLRKTAADFNASQDKYEVEVQTQPNQNFTSTVYNAVVNGEGPDIIFNYASEASKYVSAGLVANLDEYIYDEEIGIENFDELLPAYLMSEINGFEDGHIHYLPGATTGPILYYNKTMLEELNLEVPKTWEDLEKVAKAIKEAKPEVTPFGIDSKVDITQTVILESGATYIDAENKQVGFAGAVDAVAWLGKQIQDGLFALTAPSGGYFSNDFNSGLVAMYYGSCAGVPYIDPVGFEYGVAPAPSTGDENAAYTIWNR